MSFSLRCPDAVALGGSALSPGWDPMRQAYLQRYSRHDAVLLEMPHASILSDAGGAPLSLGTWSHETSPPTDVNTHIILPLSLKCLMPSTLIDTYVIMPYSLRCLMPLLYRGCC